jgi:peptidoglycan/LPS O-acetylase OafA/YrhL
MTSPPSPAETRKSQTFPALNGLRFLAALAVVIFHYAPRVSSYERLPGIIKNLIDEGPCAVGFFFILSGFVLAYRHLSPGARVQKASDFYWARFVRLYPAYLLAFLLFAPIAVERYILHPSLASTGHHTFLFSAVLSPLMLQSWTPLAQAWNGPSWSLSVEAFMYLVFPFIGFRLLKLSRRNTTFLLVASWLIPAGLAVAYISHLIPKAAWGLYITNNPLLWLPLFVMGICANQILPSWNAVATRRANQISTAAFVALISISLAWPHGWSDLFVTAGIAPLLAAVIVSFTRTSGWITRMIGSHVLSKLGEVSYVVYILQAPLWHYWQPLTNSLRVAWPQSGGVPLWQFLAFVPFLILTSFAVQRFVELPLRSWANGWRKRRSATRTASDRRLENSAERHPPQRNPIELLGS